MEILLLVFICMEFLLLNSMGIHTNRYACMHAARSVQKYRKIYLTSADALVTTTPLVIRVWCSFIVSVGVFSIFLKF
jgi:hypothetical protein